MKKTKFEALMALLPYDAETSDDKLKAKNQAMDILHLCEKSSVQERSKKIWCQLAVIYDAIATFEDDSSLKRNWLEKSLEAEKMSKPVLANEIDRLYVRYILLADCIHEIKPHTNDNIKEAIDIYVAGIDILSSIPINERYDNHIEENIEPLRAIDGIKKCLKTCKYDYKQKEKYLNEILDHYLSLFKDKLQIPYSIFLKVCYEKISKLHPKSSINFAIADFGRIFFSKYYEQTAADVNFGKRLASLDFSIATLPFSEMIRAKKDFLRLLTYIQCCTEHNHVTHYGKDWLEKNKNRMYLQSLISEYQNKIMTLSSIVGESPSFASAITVKYLDLERRFTAYKRKEFDRFSIFSDTTRNNDSTSNPSKRLRRSLS